MSRDEILAMEPGVEMDMLVELELFDKTASMYYQPRSFSTDISAAWEVVEKMDENYMFRLTTSIESKWYAQFSVHDSHRVYCETAPESIVKAALLAVMDT